MQKAPALVITCFLGIAGCRETPSQPTPTQPSPKAVGQPDEPTGRFHPAGPGPEHAKQKDAPPPKAPRSAPPDVMTTDTVEVTVSDLDLAVDGTATAVIELRPIGGWILNTEFPVKIHLAGITIAEPERAAWTEPGEGLQMTSGGLRLDVAFRGVVPGSEAVEATVRFGVCAETSCLARRVVVPFRVSVQP